jgi:hypothetical protein
MMKRYPHDTFAVRKDLFTAFSFIIKSTHKVGFHKHIDELLDEDNTIGLTTSAVFINMKSLCYNAILEFMDSSKHELSVSSNLEKAV